MKTPPANVTSASPSEPIIRYRMMKTSAFFRKLSLNAEKNCAQNSGAKRRFVIKLPVAMVRLILGMRDRVPRAG